MDYDPHAMFCSVSPMKDAEARDNLVDDVNSAYGPDDVIYEKGGLVTFVFQEDNDISDEDIMNMADCCKEFNWSPENF